MNQSRTDHVFPALEPRGYARLIASLAGTADPAALALLEELMRAGRTGLDGLAPAELAAAAGDAIEDTAGLEAAGQLAAYCGALGLAVPAAAGR